MERADIERRDFPVGRRGYDQGAVDSHLRRVADELEALRERAAGAGPSLSAGASEHVRAILEAAERSAAELREDAGRQAGDHVARVAEAAGGMLARLDELEGELSKLLAALRERGERLVEELERLRGEVGAIEPAMPAETAVVEEDFAAAAPAEVEPLEPPPAAAAPSPSAAEPAPSPAEPAPSSAEPAPSSAEPAPAPSSAEPARSGAADGEEAGARLIALNMALSGRPREETAAYLTEHFTLADAEALLDDVYARAAK